MMLEGRELVGVHDHGMPPAQQNRGTAIVQTAPLASKVCPAYVLVILLGVVPPPFKFGVWASSHRPEHKDQSLMRKRAGITA